ncbi:hypothetical protein N7537_010330 [Penicillium hordei]|uniref:Extracellular membrane protein CFEM domain-containing protein n=1 Tax=Penicillium hordei TaxID=40994 RepID=A0AAD6DUH6_9EURO|nr:uncharacterized protein N7537_010330 [Penicillium hordei]KAJ5593426.1 hypothetical protein N7537_010330 [Penicillium hordei]
MARFPAVFVLFALLAATLVTAFNQTLELENSNCDNNCYFDSFPGGSCTDDPACMCDKQQYREAYFCCMKDCNPNVMPDSITRQHRECKARNMDFTFDAEALCGIKLTTSAGFLVAAATTTSTPAAATVTVTATAAADSTATGDSKSSTPSVSTNSAASSTITQAASSTGTKTSSVSSMPAPTNSAPGKGAIRNAAMILVALSAVMLV